VGNIVGVCSRQAPEIIQRDIPNWQFSAQLIDNSVFGNEMGVFPMNSSNIGRAFPGVAELPQQPGVPQGNGGQPNGDGPSTQGQPSSPRPELPFGVRPRPPRSGEG
jgi:hypothetical protein